MEQKYEQEGAGEEERAWEEERARSVREALALSGGKAQADIPAEQGESRLAARLWQTGSTALITINPDRDIKVVALYNEGLKLRDYALSREIRNDKDMLPATDDLAIIARLKKSIEEKRKEYVDPIRHHLDSVNNAFREFTAPVTEADQVNRDKIKAYRTEVERRRQEAEEINRQTIELARKQAELNQGEFTVDLTPVKVPEVRRRVYTGMGSTSTQKVYKWEVADPSLVPREYLIPNAALIGSVVRSSKGSISIPGIKVWTEDAIRVNTK